MGGGAAPAGGQDVEAVYDAIAEAWVKTRSGPWPEVRDFLGRFPRGARVVDVGVGSGRYLQVEQARGLSMVGFDVSRGQLAVARRQVPGARLVRADGRVLPLKGRCADGVLLVAVVHHFAERAMRVRAARECARVMRPGGHALITAWGTDAEDFQGAKQAPGGGKNDFLIPFKAEQPVPVERFFHAYEAGELESEAREGGMREAREWTARGNRFVEGSV